MEKQFDEIKQFMDSTRQQLAFSTQTKLDEIDLYGHLRLALETIGTSISKADRRFCSLVSVCKDLSVRVCSTEIMTSVVKNQLEDNMQMIGDHLGNLTDKVKGLDCKFDLLHCKLNSRSREFRADTSDAKDKLCHFYKLGKCTRESCQFSHDFVVTSISQSKGKLETAIPYTAAPLGRK